MSTITEPLILDLVEWVAKKPRAYAEVIDAWRTSCPRLTVWEDAVDRGLLRPEAGPRNDIMVVVTPEGQQLLRSHGRIVRQETSPANA
jgi:hypothetical protein